MKNTIKPILFFKLSTKIYCGFKSVFFTDRQNITLLSFKITNTITNKFAKDSFLNKS
jgi:hypothetical protein